MQNIAVRNDASLKNPAAGKARRQHTDVSRYAAAT
jgi:hypothetical protein